MGGPGRDLSKELFGGGQPPVAGQPQGRDLSKDLFEGGASQDGQPNVPAWQKALKTVQFPNGSQSVQRPDGAVYIKEANDPRFKGDEGWKLFDPKTGVWAPASAEDASALRTLPAGLGMDALRSWGRNLLAGVQRPIDAGGQLTADLAHAVGLMGDKTYLDTIHNYEGRERYRQALKNTSGAGAGFTQGIGEALPTVAITALAPEATGTTFAQRAGANALSAGGTSYLTTPGSTEDRAKAGLTAMVAAPVMQAGLEKVVAPLVGKAVNAAKGVKTPGAAEIEALGEKFKVPVSAGDATGAPGTKKLEVALENVPGVGMGTFRAEQDKAAAEAAARTAKGLLKEMASQGWSNIDQVKRAAAQGRKGAQLLLDELANAGDDWERVVQASGNLKGFTAKLQADALYDKVGQLSSQLGEVPLINTIRALEDLKRELAAAHLPDASVQKVVSLLESRMKATQPQVGTVAAQVRQAVGAPPMVQGQGQAQSVVDNSFNGLRQLRSRLGGMIQDAKKGGGEITGTDASNALQRLRNAVEQDMEAFGKSNGPELAAAWRDADSYYRTAVVPYKDRALAKALTEGHPDEIFGQFIKAGKGDRAQKFYESLDAKGQSAVRYGLVQNALEAAANPAKGDQAAVFSPARFAGYLEKMGDATGVAFKGQDKWEIDGLAKLMRHIERAGQFAENPPTGNRVAQLGTGLGLMELGRVNPGAAVGTWTVAKLSQQLLTTPGGKRLLLAASSLPPGSPAMQKLLTTRLPQVLGTEASSGTTAKPADE